jgi:hypothetical protein
MIKIHLETSRTLQKQQNKWHPHHPGDDGGCKQEVETMCRAKYLSDK